MTKQDRLQYLISIGSDRTDDEEIELIHLINVLDPGDEVRQIQADIDLLELILGSGL